MSTITATRNMLQLSARTVAWAGVVLGVLAFFFALPPIEARAPVVPLVE